MSLRSKVLVEFVIMFFFGAIFVYWSWNKAPATQLEVLEAVLELPPLTLERLPLAVLE